MQLLRKFDTDPQGGGTETIAEIAKGEFLKKARGGGARGRNPRNQEENCRPPLSRRMEQGRRPKSLENYKKADIQKVGIVETVQRCN